MFKKSSQPSGAPTTGVRLLPPLIFLVAILIGAALHKVWPLGDPFPQGSKLIATALAIVAIGIAVYSVVLFRKFRTDIDPRGTATTLLRSGPYRFSRNPIYLAMVLLTIAIGFRLESVWILLMLVPTVYVIQRYVIELEEQHLATQFGDEYEQYSRDVRRWI